MFDHNETLDEARARNIRDALFEDIGISDWTARLMGLVPSLIFGGCMTLAVVGATAKLAPKLRRLDLRDLH